MIVRYDSIAALRRDYLAKGCQRLSNFTSDLSWYNNETEETSLRLAEIGDTALVPQAEAALAKLDLVIETPRKAWERNVAGAFCAVPDYLAGLPTPMRRQVQVRDERAPITIFVDTGSNASISSSTITQRGIIILALVMALARIRPVALFQLHAAHGIKDGETITISQINTSPLDLATACYVLTSAGFTRRLVYKLANKNNGYNGHFAATFNPSNQNLYYNNLKPKLVSDPSRCLIIPKALANDRLLLEPLAWIQNQIAFFTQNQEEALP